MGFEKVYSQIGEFGKYQKVLFAIVSFGVFIPGMQNTASVYLQYTPDYLCKDNLINFGKNTTECAFYDFDHNMTSFSTVSTEYLLILERKKNNMMITSAYFFGFFMGAFMGGMISDNYGRKTALILGLVGNLGVGLLTSYSTNWWQFMILRALVGLFC